LMLLAFVIVCVMVPTLMAQSTYHKPISTGDTSRHVDGDKFDTSGVAWYVPGSKWLVIE